MTRVVGDIGSTHRNVTRAPEIRQRWGPYPQNFGGKSPRRATPTPNGSRWPEKPNSMSATLKITIENELGEQETFHDAQTVRVEDDGKVKVRHIKPGHDDHIFEEREFGPEWRIVRVTA